MDKCTGKWVGMHRYARTNFLGRDTKMGWCCTCMMDGLTNMLGLFFSLGSRYPSLVFLLSGHSPCGCISTVPLWDQVNRLLSPLPWGRRHYYLLLVRIKQRSLFAGLLWFWFFPPVLGQYPLQVERCLQMPFLVSSLCRSMLNCFGRHRMLGPL